MLCKEAAKKFVQKILDDEAINLSQVALSFTLCEDFDRRHNHVITPETKSRNVDIRKYSKRRKK